MNERDPLDEELAAMRPLPPSPELKQRIGERLEASVAIPAPSRRWRIAALGGLAIAALFVVLLCWPRETPIVVPAMPEASTDPHPVFDESLPSLWTYRSILLQSPQALEALLDSHSPHASQSDPEPVRAYPMTRIHTEPFPGGL